MQLEHESLPLLWTEKWDIGCVHLSEGKPKAGAESFSVRGIAFEAGLCAECLKGSKTRRRAVVSLPLAS